MLTIFSDTVTNVKHEDTCVVMIAAKQRLGFVLCTGCFKTLKNMNKS